MDRGRGLLARSARLSLVGPAAPLADRERWRRLLEKLQDKRWAVYCKPPFGDNPQVFRYLGHDTHRVGLSNQRLVSLDEHSVTFRTRGDGKVTVTPDEFLRRFVLHVLPKGLRRSHPSRIIALVGPRHGRERLRPYRTRRGKAAFP